MAGGGKQIKIQMQLTGAAQIRQEAEKAAQDLQRIFQKYGAQDVGGLAGRMFAGGGQTPQGRASLSLMRYRAPDTIAAYATSQGMNQVQQEAELASYQRQLGGLSAVAGIQPRGEQETAGSGLGTLARFGTSFARGLLGVTAIAAPGYAAAKLMQRFNDMAVNEGLQISQLRRLAPPGMSREQFFHLGTTGGTSAYMDPAQFTQFLGGVGAQAGARGIGNVLTPMMAQMTRQFGLSPEQGAGFFGAEARLGVDNPAALKKLADAIADAVSRGRMHGLEGETLSALAESTSKLAQRVVGPEAVYQGANLATLDLAGRLQALGPAFFGSGGIQTMANVQQNINSRSLFNMPDLVKPFLMNEMNKAGTMTVPGFGKIDLTTPEGMEKAKQFLTTTPDGQKILGNMLASARTSGGSFTEYSLAQQLGLQTMLGGYGPLEGMLGGTSASMTKGVADAYKKYSQQQSDAEKQVAEQARMYSELTLAGERLAPIFLRLSIYAADAAGMLKDLSDKLAPTYHKMAKDFTPGATILGAAMTDLWHKVEHDFGGPYAVAKDALSRGLYDFTFGGGAGGMADPAIAAMKSYSAAMGEAFGYGTAAFGMDPGGSGAGNLTGIPGTVGVPAGISAAIGRIPTTDKSIWLGMDPRKAAIMKAIIAAESGGDSNAVNPKTGATGLGQFLISTARTLMPGMSDAQLREKLKDPAFNEALMSRYIDVILQHGGNLNDPESIMGRWHDGPNHVGLWSSEATAEMPRFRAALSVITGGKGYPGSSTSSAAMDVFKDLKDAVVALTKVAASINPGPFHHDPPSVLHLTPPHPAAPRGVSKPIVNPKPIPGPAPH